MDDSKNVTSSLLTPDSVKAMIFGAMALALNILRDKYSSYLSTPFVVVICTIPLLLFIFFICRFGKNREGLSKIFKRIFLYFLIGLIVLPFLYYAISMSHYFLSIKGGNALMIPKSELQVQGNIEMKNQVTKPLGNNLNQALSANTKKKLKKRNEDAQKQTKIDQTLRSENGLSIPSSIANLEHLSAVSSTPIFKENTQTCIGSNCVQGNNYGKMEINQYGPAKLLMTDDQELAVTKAMGLYAGSEFEIILNQMISDLDSKNYAEKLRNALLNARMVCTGYGNTVIISDEPIPPGISMTVGTDKEYVMNALKNVLEETGLPKELVSAKVIETPSDTLKIIITPNH